MSDFKFNLDKDTKAILKVMLEDEILLRCLSIKPASASDNVLDISLARPSIIGTTTLQERFEEFYFSKDATFINWAKYPEQSLVEKGRVYFYPANLSIKGEIDRNRYHFDIYIPYSWHKMNNSTYIAIRRLVQLFKNEKIFGNVGNINGEMISTIINVESYVGYKMILSNYDFVNI